MKYIIVILLFISIDVYSQTRTNITKGLQRCFELDGITPKANCMTVTNANGEQIYVDSMYIDSILGVGGSGGGGIFYDMNGATPTTLATPLSDSAYTPIKYLLFEGLYGGLSTKIEILKEGHIQFFNEEGNGGNYIMKSLAIQEGVGQENFNFAHSGGGNISGARNNEVFTWGWNAGIDNLEDAGKTANFFSWEGHYSPTLSQKYYELHLVMVDSSGNVYKPWTWFLNKGNPALWSLGNAVRSFYIKNPTELTGSDGKFFEVQCGGDDASQILLLAAGGSTGGSTDGFQFYMDRVNDLLVIQPYGVMPSTANMFVNGFDRFYADKIYLDNWTSTGDPTVLVGGDAYKGLTNTDVDWGLHLVGNDLEVDSTKIINWNDTLSGGKVATDYELSLVVAGAIPDADYGDIIVSSSGTVWNINAGVVGDPELGTGLDITQFADGTTNNTELQYINSLSSNAQTQINGKANTALSNLASVAINTTLLPSTDDTYDLGSATFQWKDLYMTGASIYFSGVKTLSNAGLNLPTGAGLRTRTGAGNTLLLQAYDVDGTSYTTFGTLTANNTPTFDFSTAVTFGGSTLASLYQPLDADLTTIAGLTATTDNFLVSNSSAWASRTPTQVRTTLALTIGTDVQAYDADLTTYAGITPSANVQTLLGSANYAAFKTSLSLDNVANIAVSGTNTGDQTSIVGISGTKTQFNTSVSDGDILYVSDTSSMLSTLVNRQEVYGTLADGANALSLTATFPTTITAANNAINYTITGAGSSSFDTRAMAVTYAAGYTGGNVTTTILPTNSVAGTGTNIFGNSNRGVGSNANATTTGTNIGVNGTASGGDISIGLSGRVTTAKNAATNVGVFGAGLNTGTTPIQLGGYFGLQNANPTFTSAALMADNGSQTDPIFVARDNGTATFTIADAGAINATGTARFQKKEAAASTSTSVTFTSAHYGQTFLWSPSGTATATLPANGAAAGSWFDVIVLTNQTTTISSATADTLITDGDTQADSVAFSTTSHKIGSSVRFISDGTSWIAINFGSTTMTIAT